MNTTIKAIIIFAVAVVLTVASLIISQVFQDRDKDILSSGFIGLTFLFAFVALASATCAICTIWPQS